ncbi:MAG: DUF368 domain-containing protein [Erysipelotrichales bacterium]|nr:DUF368 domain-containing protein [Erysipelotrichales bacterium]
MIKTIIGGIAVGIANIIPGVSGGTMMVVLGIFNPLMEAINDVVSINAKNRKKDIIFIAQVLVGVLIGLVGFAKVIEYLFGNYYTQTMFWFIGMIVFSIPSLIKSEMKGKKLDLIWFILGLAVIAAMYYFSPEKGDVVITVFPAVSLFRLIKLIFVGSLSGAAMLLPGISGSMLMLIIGEYYYFKSYIANVFTFQINVLIPLAAIALGIVLGIILSSKVTSYCLEKYRARTMSFILGLIIASSVVLIPLQSYTLTLGVTCVASFLVGGAIILGIEKLVK